MKHLSLNGPESECISSACLVAMLRKIAEKGGKPVEIIEAKPAEGRVMKQIGKALLIVVGLYFGISLLIWWAKP